MLAGLPNPEKNGAGDFLGLTRNLGHCGGFFGLFVLFFQCLDSKLRRGRVSPHPTANSKFAAG